jgi:hypothetical protein
MRGRTCVALGAFSFGLWLVTGTSMTGEGTWKCTAKPVGPCVKRHGRLSSQNGIALKIWLIGTTRMVALDNDFDDLPPAVRKYLEMTSPDHSYIFGDFEICPLEPDEPGHIRRVCVVGGERLVVQPLAASTPPFRLPSTWPIRGQSMKGR